MKATWRRQCPRRIKYQPEEMKIVLMKFSDALIAGKSEIVIVAPNVPGIRRRAIRQSPQTGERLFGWRELSSTAPLGRDRRNVVQILGPARAAAAWIKNYRAVDSLGLFYAAGPTESRSRDTDFARADHSGMNLIVPDERKNRRRGDPRVLVCFHRHQSGVEILRGLETDGALLVVDAHGDSQGMLLIFRHRLFMPRN